MTPIAELFERDPLDLTEPDLDQIIEYFRAKRSDFKKSKATAAAKKARARRAAVNVEVKL